MSSRIKKEWKRRREVGRKEASKLNLDEKART